MAEDSGGIPQPVRKKSMPFIFGAPIRKKDRLSFVEAMEERFEGAMETAVAYVERVSDRQINKARGLLSYNALLVAIFELSESQDLIKHIGSLSALSSALLLLILMYVVWGACDQYRSASEDFKRGCEILYRRAWILTLSLIASIAATVLAVVPTALSLVG